MNSKKRSTKSVDSIIVRFAGDSGDGMQLTGNRFSTTSAMIGDDLTTLPDYPAEIRAPIGTIFGVSGFQIHFGKGPIYTPGDNPNVLVAMNPAALKGSLKDLKINAIIIVNEDAFNEKNLKLAEFESNPLEDNSLKDFQVFPVPITTLTRRALDGLNLSQKQMDRCKNFFALGMMYWMYNRPLESTQNWIEEKFSKQEIIAQANIKAMTAGYNFADTTEVFTTNYQVKKSVVEPGHYRNLTGNEALALGLVSASVKSGLEIFLGSYPITPASDILHELSKHKNFGVKTFQAEDEIGAVTSAIGASFAGSIGITSTSGPGVALKTEAIGLAVITELPLIICNVQQGGPSTGLPTKTEQSDLLQAVYGRNGEAPVPVIAAQSPSDCFHAAYNAVRIAIQFMTPVFLLSDGYIANGSESWKIPDENDLKPIDVKFETDPDKFAPYYRYPDTLARKWAIPGTPGLEHRIGGLEKEDITGNVSYDQDNHERMVRIRSEKIKKIADFVDDPKIFGEDSGDVLVLSWGSTFGTVHTVVDELINDGHKVSSYHLRWINPLPKSLNKYIRNFKHVIVPEINLGQLVKIIRSEYLVDAQPYNVVKGLPLNSEDLKENILSTLKEI